jgi:hypothetical protein
MKCMIRHINSGGKLYDALAFCCPGCAELHDNDGLHVLPVNTDQTTSWDWNNDLENPTLTPSLLTGAGDPRGQCHSYLTEGKFHFLMDSNHSLAGETVAMPDLPEWFARKLPNDDQW